MHIKTLFASALLHSAQFIAAGESHLECAHGAGQHCWLLHQPV